MLPLMFAGSLRTVASPILGAMPRFGAKLRPMSSDLELLFLFPGEKKSFL